MIRRPLIQTIPFALCFVLLGFVPLQAAENTGDLEQRVKQLEQQLTELKTLLQAEKEEEEKEKAAEAAKPAEPEKPAGMTLLGKGTLQVGGDIRFRPEYFDNVWDYNDDGATEDSREVIRFRPRVFLDWKPADNMEAYIRMTKEWVYGQDNEHFGYDVEGKDAMFDNAWGEWKDIYGSGVNLRIGRQDLIYGEGFVVLDGTPQDGSQTISFDAAKLTVNHDLGATDLLFAKMVELNSQLADDEDLYGIYNKLTFDQVEGLGLEPYFLSRSKRARANITGAPGTVSYPFSPYDPSPREQTYLVGMRATYKTDIATDVTLALAAEGGKEFGQVEFTGSPVLDYANLAATSSGYSRNAANDVDRDAWGGYINGTLTFNAVPWKPSFKAGVTYFSGDDPSTEDYEGWDDFYAQWPKYSELYVYTLYDGFKFATRGNDPEVGMWSNMIIPEAMITVKPTDRLTQSLRYLYYLAEESIGPGGGDERGHNLQWLTQYVFTDNLSGHFLGEWFAPGDFYGPDADDAFYARIELMYKF
ncbi:MAG: alginate export family protein [Candidatus Omnitrophota bacterium]